ncbi:hypothetical protein CHUAL_001580 [Chamberlinius hualienensis]
MDGIEPLKGVTVVAATNRPDKIDKALLRAGRFDRIVYVPLPDQKTREDIFRIQFQKIPVADDVSVEYLASQTNEYSGAEIVAVCNEAGLKAMSENFDTENLKASHFEIALTKIKPRTYKKMIRFYEEYVKKSGDVTLTEVY